MTHQLSLTDGYGDDVEDRKERLREAQQRAKDLLQQWRKKFGQDDPLAIDTAWDHLVRGLDSVQHDSAERQLEAAHDALDDAEWFIQHTETQ